MISYVHIDQYFGGGKKRATCQYCRKKQIKSSTVVRSLHLPKQRCIMHQLTLSAVCASVLAGRPSSAELPSGVLRSSLTCEAFLCRGCGTAIRRNYFRFTPFICTAVPIRLQLPATVHRWSYNHTYTVHAPRGKQQQGRASR